MEVLLKPVISHQLSVISYQLSVISERGDYSIGEEYVN